MVWKDRICTKHTLAISRLADFSLCRITKTEVASSAACSARADPPSGSMVARARALGPL